VAAAAKTATTTATTTTTTTTHEYINVMTQVIIQKQRNILLLADNISVIYNEILLSD
jgi:hypothetical protein